MRVVIDSNKIFAALRAQNTRFRETLCNIIDEFDTPFIALALELDAPLWTNDEKLKAALRSQGFDAFM